MPCASGGHESCRVRKEAMSHAILVPAEMLRNSRGGRPHFIPGFIQGFLYLVLYHRSLVLKANRSRVRCLWIFQQSALPGGKAPSNVCV